MKKVPIGKSAYVYPIPTILLGANVDGKPNYCTVGNCGIISVRPPVVYVSSDKSNHTNIGIKQTMSFSINVPSTSMVEKADYCGLVSGRDVDKSALFESFHCEEASAPMIRDCPINVLCAVVENMEIHSMEIFIADVVEAYADEDCLVNGKPNIKKIDPIIYSLKGNYWNIGEEIAQAFSVGRSLQTKKQ
jgi:flavin reductase (DIM6/NTAB) family NADH-FMN oxidoreductase RutF